MQTTLLTHQQQERIVTNFVETIDNLLPLQSPDLDQTAGCIEAIGLRLRCDAKRGLLMYAKLILDRATSANH